MWKASQGILCLIVVSMCLTGCGGGAKPGAYDLTVTLDEQLKQNDRWPTIDVDLVGVGPSERESWKSKSIDAYFSPHDPDKLRQQAREHSESKTLKFSNSAPPSQTLSRKDEIWQKWKKANKPEVFVIADLPAYAGKGDADGQRRRLIVPLDKRRWNNSQSINIVVRRDGLKYVTEPGPEPAK